MSKKEIMQSLKEGLSLYELMSSAWKIDKDVIVDLLKEYNAAVIDYISNQCGYDSKKINATLIGLNIDLINNLKEWRDWGKDGSEEAINE